MSASEIPKPELIVALDAKAEQESWEIISRLADAQKHHGKALRLVVKFNDLARQIGFDGLRKMLEPYPQLGIFVDGKDHDTNPTNTNHIQRLIDSGLAAQTRYYTVHPESYAAERTKWDSNTFSDTLKLLTQYPWLRTLAITWLTTLNDKASRRMNGKPAKWAVLDRAHLALEKWIHGIVASAEEAALLRAVFGKKFGDFSIVTPWLRFEWNDPGDQMRVMSPWRAREHGSTAAVMGTDILKNPQGLSLEDAIEKFRQESEGVVHINTSTPGIDARLEELVRLGTIPEILAYIGATYDRPATFPEGHGYIRWDSGVITNKYTNLSVLEKHPQVLTRVSRDMADKLEEQKIVPQMIIGAAMWSVRLSDRLWEMLGVPSIYAEKAADGSMIFNRHDIPEGPIDVVICEDTISKWGTVEKIIAALQKFPNVRILWVTSVARNTVNDVDFWVPFVSLVDIPKPTELYHDEQSFIDPKTGKRRPETDCEKLAKNPQLATPSELVGSGKPYVKELQKLVREGRWTKVEDFEGIVTQK